MEVWVHTRGNDKSDWHSEAREFSRLPAVGEYLAYDATGSYYKVIRVIHNLYDGRQYAADILAVHVKREEVW